MMDRKKIIAVASIGGHWIQLLRIAQPLEEKYNVVYVCTHKKCATMVEGKPYHTFLDFSRWNIWKAIPAAFYALYLLLKVHPKAVISTGAAPGLITLFVAKALRIKTIWIDSIANAEHPSASGRMAAKFADRCYTQWPHEANEKFRFSGNIFG